MFRTVLIAVLCAVLTGPAVASDGELFRGFGTTQPDRPAVPATTDQPQPRQATSRPDAPAWNPTSRPDFDGLPAVIKALTAEFFAKDTDPWRKQELAAKVIGKTVRVTMPLKYAGPDGVLLQSRIDLSRTVTADVTMSGRGDAALSPTVRATTTGKAATIVGRVTNVAAADARIKLQVHLLHISQSTR